MEQDLEVGTDREAESGLERFVGGDTLKRVLPRGSKWVPGFPIKPSGMTLRVVWITVPRLGLRE